MPYLVDGHNLIPRVGLSLDAMDDEMALIERLRRFSRVKKKRVEVYFDGAPPGQNRTRKFGYVTAHFVRKGRTADAAIAARLRRMGKSAKNWTVVSSDREVVLSAKSARAAHLSSDAFAEQMVSAEAISFDDSDNEHSLSESEVEQWLRLFTEEGNKTK